MMTTMIATTIAQSKTLLNLGVDPKTADMAYLSGNPEMLVVKTDDVERELFDGREIPAWSLSALFDFFPKAMDEKWRIESLIMGGYRGEMDCPVGCKQIENKTLIGLVFEMACFYEG